MDLAWCLVCLGYVTQQTHVPLAWRPRHSSHLQEARAPSLPFPFSSSLSKLFSSDEVQYKTDGISAEEGGFVAVIQGVPVF